MNVLCTVYKLVVITMHASPWPKFTKSVPFSTLELAWKPLLASLIFFNFKPVLLYELFISLIVNTDPFDLC